MSVFRHSRVSLPDIQKAIANEDDDAIKSADVAKALRVNIRTVRALLDRSVLASCVVREQHGACMRRYVSTSSIKSFATEFISVVDLTARTGRLPGAKAILQIERGVQPVALEGGFNMVFRRSDF